jgi:hypothetical protein
MNAKVKTLLLSYLYAAFSVIAALWMSGTHDWQTLGIAAITAVLAPAAQAANPADKTVGIGAGETAPQD